MINPLEQYIERAQPVIEAAKSTAHSYCERVIARLDSINDNIARSRWEETRRYFNRTVINTDGRLEVVEVPSTEEWQLEAIAVNRSPAVNEDVIVRAGGMFRLIVNNNHDLQPVIVQGGALITVETTSATGLEVFLQFRRRDERTRSTRFAGQIENADDRLDSPAAENKWRHSTPGVFQMPSVIGEGNPRK